MSTSARPAILNRIHSALDAAKVSGGLRFFGSDIHHYQAEQNYFAFYNCDTHSGASQPHKPSSAGIKDAYLIMDKLFAIPSFPFAHHIRRFLSVAERELGYARAHALRGICLPS